MYSDYDHIHKLDDEGLEEEIRVLDKKEKKELECMGCSHSQNKEEVTL